MIIKRLKITIYIKVVVILALIVGLYLFCEGQFSELSKLEKREKSEFSMLKQVRTKINNFNSKTDDIKNALTTWGNITAEVKEFKGLQLGEAKKILDKLEKKHGINKLDVKLSKPEILQGKYKGVKVGVESTVLKLKIRSYTDIKVFYFLYDVLTLLPGYPKIVKFTLKKTHDLNTDNLLRITRDPGFSPILAEIDIKWDDLKEFE